MCYFLCYRKTYEQNRKIKTNTQAHNVQEEETVRGRKVKTEKCVQRSRKREINTDYYYYKIQ